MQIHKVRWKTIVTTAVAAVAGGAATPLLGDKWGPAVVVLAIAVAAQMKRAVEPHDPVKADPAPAEIGDTEPPPPPVGDLW